MNIQDFYCIIGEDYDSFYNRLPDQNSITSFVKKFPEDDSFEKLAQSVTDRDYPSAFQYALTLKGIALNLSFKKLAEASGNLVDYLKDNLHPEGEKVRKLMHKTGEIYTDIIVSIQQNAL